MAYISNSPESKLAKCFSCSEFTSPKPNANAFRTFITSCLLAMGVHLVIDVTWARDLCLYEAGLEFIAHSAGDQYERTEAMPLFSSICPGWICYAEKSPSSSVSSTESTHNEFSILPHISKIRSPQQIAGRIIKLIGEERCFHVSIMPCFDKKLEASREEFSVQSSVADCRVPDVDLVLATNELLYLLESFCHESDGSLVFSPPTYAAELGENNRLILSRLCEVFHGQWNVCNRTNNMPSENKGVVPMYRHSGSGSGGYAAYIFRFAAEKLFSINLDLNLSEDEHVLVRQLQNRDLQEMLLFNTKEDRNLAASLLSSHSNRIPYRHLEIIEPKALLVFAVANGFRNIQTIVQYLRKIHQVAKFEQKKIKQTKSMYPFDYVEVMACPNGCLNGGGQIKELLKQTNEVYANLAVAEPMSNDLVQSLYSFIKSRDPDRKSLHTTYRTVPKIEIVNPSALKW
ncbi:unnamed protein product [Trichobilharzia szidati]|nr:unnamed protein product [Trichobilharzia szidati]